MFSFASPSSINGRVNQNMFSIWCILLLYLNTLTILLCPLCCVEKHRLLSKHPQFTACSNSCNCLLLYVDLGTPAVPIALKNQDHPLNQPCLVQDAVLVEKKEENYSTVTGCGGWFVSHDESFADNNNYKKAISVATKSLRVSIVPQSAHYGDKIAVLCCFSAQVVYGSTLHLFVSRQLTACLCTEIA